MEKVPTYVKNTTNEVIGENKCRMPKNKVTRWGSEEIQKVVANKKKQFKIKLEKQKERRLDGVYKFV